MIFYICDLQDHCCGQPGCARMGGECIHTTHVEHAVNGGCENPASDPERFECETFVVNSEGKRVTYFWERSKSNQKEEEIIEDEETDGDEPDLSGDLQD